MIAIYNSSLQKEIIDSLDISYKSMVSTRINLIQSKSYLLDLDKKYYNIAITNTLASIQEDYNNNFNCRLIVDDFESLYKRFRSEKKSRELILDRNINSICSYCMRDIAEEIDHYLPQSKFKSLSIIYNNLVPSCHSCNHKKGSKTPKIKGTWFFHPNFTYINCNIFLHVETSIDSSKLVFSTNNEFEDAILKSIDFTFRELGIYKKYSRLAHFEILDKLYYYHNLKENSGLTVALDYIKQLIEGNAKACDELWKRSLYKFILDNRYFHNYEYIIYAKRHGIIL